MSQDRGRDAAPPSALLYVPADRPERFEKAAAAPGMIIDLEDSVSSGNKQTARRALTEHLVAGRVAPETWVRISADAIVADLDAITSGAAIAGVMVAKASPEALRQVASAKPGLPMIALIEDARALGRLAEMAEVDSLVTFAMGEVDLLADLRIRRADSTAAVIDTLRLTVVRAAAAAGLHAPIAPTSLEVRDLGSIERTTAHLKDLGFRGRTAIHPAQCPPIVQAFTPSPDEVTRAKQTIEALESSHGGVAVGADGRFIDPAVVRESREILSRAPSVKAQDT